MVYNMSNIMTLTLLNNVFNLEECTDMIFFSAIKADTEYTQME
jgi:hypothetical protein